MSTFKKAEVVMLPTKKAKVGQINIQNYGKGLLELIHCVITGDGLLPQHLYFTTDEEIKEGDWFILDETIRKAEYSTENFYIHYIGENESHFSINKMFCKKIIATTDASIFITKSNGSLGQAIINLPKPSPEFIAKYIKAYNEGNKIEEVMVEYEDLNDYDDDDESGRLPILRLKISKDNTIAIKKVKESWGREEVTELLIQAIAACNSSNGELVNKEPHEAAKWIEENL